MFFIKEICKVLPLGLGVPVMIGAASIGPDEAISNLGKWAHKFGISNLPDWLSNPSFDHIAIVFTGILAVIYILIVWGLPLLRNRKRPLNSKASSFGDGVERRAEIDIVIGHDGHYIESENHNVYNVMKTVSIGVRNIGNTSLTNCKLYFETRNPDTNVPVSWLRENSFSLNQGEERYISLAAYNEPLPPHPKGEDWIRLSHPPSGTYWRAPQLPEAGGAVTIKAVSAESRPCEVICKLWVENNKLHWEKA